MEVKEKEPTYTRTQVLEMFDFCFMGLNGSRVKWPAGSKDLMKLLLDKYNKPTKKNV